MKAKAEVVELENVIVEKVKCVNLTLTMEQAETLYDIVHKISGSPDKSRRKHADSIFGALRELFPLRIDPALRRDMHGSIDFSQGE
jgi:hypothetical protein